MKSDSQHVQPTISVLVQPEEKEFVLPRPKTVQQLLKTLGLGSCAALVAREGELLTPDRAIYSGNRILVRKVISSG
jgi:sulfur carrier protein ThiS